MYFMNKIKKMTFLIVFLIVIISTIPFSKPHYSIDTLEFLNNGYDIYIHSKFLVDGRIFSAMLLKLVIDMPMKYIIPIFYIIGIFISCIAVMCIRNLIIYYIKTEEKVNIIPTIIGYCIIFNFMYIDTFQFMEFPIIALSVLIYVVVSKIIVEKKKFYIVKSFILTLIAMFCYQGTITVLIVTTFVILIIKNKKLNKNVILDMLKLGIIIFITILINYGFTEIMGGTDRLKLNILENAKSAFINLYMIIFNSNNHYPKYLQLIFFSIILIYCLVKKVKILNLIWIWSISIGINIITLITTGSGMMNSNVLFGRVFFTIGGLIGYIFMYLWCTNDIMRNDKIIKGFLIIYFVTILITYFHYTHLYMKGQYIDEYIITNIDKVISKYESQTGNKIEKFIYQRDFDNFELLSTQNILNKKYHKSDLTIISSARRSNESISDALFKLYINRKIEQIPRGDMDVKEEYFNNIDLNEIDIFDERRFVFVDDTVYILI